MVEILLRRALGALELLTFLFLLAAAGSEKMDGYRRGETLTTRMKIESLANATRYRRIETFMRNYLRNDPEEDSSFINVLVHPKANVRIAEAVLKACTETKSVVLWRDEKNTTDLSYGCEFNETCSKVTRVIGIYGEVEDIDPREWRSSFGMAWNPRSKIAIWLDHRTISDDSTDNVEYENILGTFWSLNAVNVVLLVAPLCENDQKCNQTWKPRVFSYDPFVPRSGRSGKRGKLFERSIDDKSEDRSSSDDNLFPDKLSNLRGIPVRVSMYQEEPHAVLINYTQLGSGIEVNNLRYIANWLNFTVELISARTTFSDYTVQLPDGENVGPIGDLLKNRSVFLANSEYLQSTFGKRVEFVRPFARAQAKFLVPGAGSMTGIFGIFHSIGALLIALIFVNSLLLVSYFAIRKRRYPLFATWRLLMHQQVEKIGDDSPERIFLIFSILWAFVISAATQGQLIKDLTAPALYRGIDTLEELAASPLTLMFEQVDIDSLKNSDSRLKNSLGDRAVVEPNFSRCTKILVTHTNVSCAIDSAYITAAVKNLNTRKNEESAVDREHPRRKIEIVHIGKEALTEYWRTLVVQEGFPYLSKFNVAYDKIIELGLLNRWWGESVRHHFEINPPETTPRKLSLNHLERTFKILLFGQCAAFVAFFAEIIFYRAKKRLSTGFWCSS